MRYYWLAFFSVLGLDQASKLLVRLHFHPLQSVPLFEPWIYLTYIQNPGAAFGLFPGFAQSFIPVSVVAVLVFTGYVVWFRPPRIVALALGLVAGGAFGNMLDRLLFNSVIDFIDLKFWPVFNIADSAIVVGTAALFVLMVNKDVKRGVPGAKGDSAG